MHFGLHMHQYNVCHLRKTRDKRTRTNVFFDLKIGLNVIRITWMFDLSTTLTLEIFQSNTDMDV